MFNYTATQIEAVEACEEFWQRSTVHYTSTNNYFISLHEHVHNDHEHIFEFILC